MQVPPIVARPIKPSRYTAAATAAAAAAAAAAAVVMRHTRDLAELVVSGLMRCLCHACAVHAWCDEHAEH